MSDIFTGSNAIINAYIPLRGFNDNHCMIHAPNGTCKTTMISFLLNVFNPDKKRFIQYLQSDGDKKLEQYLIPARPAIVVINLSKKGIGKDLFGEEICENITIGQILHLSKMNPDNLERIYFMSENSSFFSKIRNTWPTISEQSNSFRLAKDLVQLENWTNVQTEWESLLEQKGLDPWLIDRQIDFARLEGGIKDSLKFKNEDAFLSFFLCCVTDMNIAISLREKTIQLTKQIKKYPEKKVERNLLFELKKELEAFFAHAKQWQEFSDRQNKTTSNFVKICKEIAKQKYAGESILNSLKAKEQERNSAIEIVLLEKNNEEKNAFALQYAVHIQALEKLLREREYIEEEKKHCIMLIKLLKAAPVYAQLQKLSQDFKQKQMLLDSASSGIAEYVNNEKTRAALFHAKLKMEIEHIASELKKTREEETFITTQIQELKKNIKSQEDEKVALREERAKIAQKYDSATYSLQRLNIEGSDPITKEADLKREIESLTNILHSNHFELKELENELANLRSTYENYRIESFKLQSDLSILDEILSKELASRNKISQNKKLIAISDIGQIEPWSSRLVAKVEDLLAKKNYDIRRFRNEIAILGERRNQLANINTLSENKQLIDILKYFWENGFSENEIKSFGAYLTSKYKDANKVAAHIESNPAKYLGILASNKKIIERIANLDIPEWLEQPFVISTIDQTDGNYKVEHIVAPKNKFVYSAEFKRQKLEEVEKEIAAFEKQIETEQNHITELNEAQKLLRNYQEQYNNENSLENLQSRLTNLQESIKNNTNTLKNIEEKIEAQKFLLSKKSKDLDSNNFALHHKQNRQMEISRWIEDFKDLNDLLSKMHNLDIKIDNISSILEKMANDNQKMQDKVISKAKKGFQQKSDLDQLTKNKKDIPYITDLFLTPELLEDAKNLTLSAHKELYEKAKELAAQQYSKLNIENLRKECEEAQKLKDAQTILFERQQSKSDIEENEIKKWAAKEALEIEEAEIQAFALNEQLTHRNGELESKIKNKQKYLDELKNNKHLKILKTEKALKKFAKHSEEQLRKKIQDNAINMADLEAKLKQIGSEQERDASSIASTKAALNTIALIYERIADHFPNELPEYNANFAAYNLDLELLQNMDNETRLLRKEFKKLAEESQDLKNRLKIKQKSIYEFIRTDKAKKYLKGICEHLLAYSEENLAEQCEELIITTDKLIQNIDVDIVSGENLIKQLISLLFDHIKESYSKIERAGKQRIPKHVFLYGDKKIIRKTHELDFKESRIEFENAMRNYIEELVEQDRIPEVNIKRGNVFFTELLYKLLKAIKAKDDFGIKLLKCDDSGNNYEPIGKDLGSGGEGLTTAVLLYTLLVNMRKERKTSSDSIPAFLIADNPLGICNKPQFVDTQLKMAKEMGIQCLYFTGINDPQALNLFENRISVKKSKNLVTINNKSYHRLEILEQNVGRYAH